MAKYASKKAVRHGRVTAALTVLLVATLLLLNLSVSTLAMRFGWFLNMNPDSTYPVTDACYTYLDTYVIPHAGEGIRLIFCDGEDSIRGDATQSMVLRTAEELSARYPEKVRVEYLNIWEKPSVAREYGVTASTSVIVQKGGSFRVCTLRDFFLFPAGDTSSPTAYVGEKRFAVAMKAVTTSDAPVAYLTLNHGESAADYSLMYALTDAGYLVNFVDTLHFEIPEDCALLISYNPDRDFAATDGVSAESEIDKLDAYLSRGGKFMCFMSADTFAAGGFPHLESYLAEWGVTFAHRTGKEGVEECYAVRDTAHALTPDGYTLAGQLPAAGRGAEILGGVSGTVRVSNATAITVAEGYTASGADHVKGNRTLCHLLRSYAGAEAFAGGRAVDRTEEGFGLVTLTEDRSTGGAVMVSSSTALANEESLASGVYGNGGLLLSVMQSFGQDESPSELRPQPFADDTIHTMTTQASTLWTVLLVALPVLTALVVGLVVLIRRKFA